MLRTLGGKNIGKCRLRAHQHPLSPPLSNLLEPVPCKSSKARRVLERVLGDGLRDLLRDLLRERAEDGLLRASILDFKPKLANRCRVFPVSAIFHASILDFRARLANRCKLFPVSALLRASILDFRARLANRCRVFPVYIIFRAVILDFRPRLANHCRVLPGNGFACNGHRGRRRGLVPRRRHNPK